ncbi:olfactory receptor 13C2 [Leuresthes tenuis]|uniref:olfactory receptor 13C2 n=1 Tax=Leuresthes tenuis TaxID=355514 RepID=UPI003B504841
MLSRDTLFLPRNSGNKGKNLQFCEGRTFCTRNKGRTKVEHPVESDLPFWTNHRSNSSSLEPDGVTFFIIQGLASLGEKRMILFVLLLLIYIAILGGNSMIIFVTRSDPKLTSPMYFFLHNLAFVDMVYTTTTIPNMLAGFLTDRLTISVPGCFLQMHFFIQLSVTGRGILTVMAYDRYMAICNPLRYTAIMTRPTRMLLVAGAWAFGALCTTPATVIALQRPYCGLNVVRHGWCDPSSVRRLACADTSVDNIVSLSLALVSLLTTGVLILTSYVLIAVSISRKSVAQRLKAFGTCAAHLTVVSISYSAASFVYISYRVGNFSPEVRIIVSVLYSALTPFLNPMIYSLRNRELQEAISRTLSRFRPAAVYEFSTAAPESSPKDDPTAPPAAEGCNNTELHHEQSDGEDFFSDRFAVRRQQSSEKEEQDGRHLVVSNTFDELQQHTPESLHLLATH